MTGPAPRLLACRRGYVVTSRTPGAASPTPWIPAGGRGPYPAAAGGAVFSSDRGRSEAGGRGSIGDCGRCGQPEEAHQDADRELAAVFHSLLGCAGYVVGQLAVKLYRSGRRSPGPLCAHCGLACHDAGSCPW